MSAFTQHPNRPDEHVLKVGLTGMQATRMINAIEEIHRSNTGGMPLYFFVMTDYGQQLYLSNVGAEMKAVFSSYDLLDEPALTESVWILSCSQKMFELLDPVKDLVALCQRYPGEPVKQIDLETIHWR